MLQADFDQQPPAADRLGVFRDQRPLLRVGHAGDEETGENEARDTHGSERLGAVDEDGHRTVVDQLDLHVAWKTPVATVQPAARGAAATTSS